MTVAFDATPLTLPTGGVTRYTWELARAMAVAFPDEEHWLLSDQKFSTPSTPANLHTGEGPARASERFWWLWGLHQEMTRRGVTLFHGTDFAVPYLPRRPAVMTLHDLSPWVGEGDWQTSAGRVRTRTPRLLRLGLAHMVITPSNAIRRAAIERFQLDPARILAIPHGVSEGFCRLDVPPASVPYFLFVGTLEPRKNIARMIDAWRQVRSRHHVDLVLAGRVRADFSAPAPEPGLRLLGAVPDSDLPALYCGALACLYPSLYEGFGLPVLEAMRCGALVITSRDPAILEVTRGCALDFDAYETGALANLLTQVVEDPTKYKSMQEVTRRIAECSTWNSCALKTREVYAEATRRFSHA